MNLWYKRIFWDKEYQFPTWSKSRHGNSHVILLFSTVVLQNAKIIGEIPPTANGRQYWFYHHAVRQLNAHCLKRLFTSRLDICIRQVGGFPEAAFTLVPGTLLWSAVTKHKTSTLLLGALQPAHACSRRGGSRWIALPCRASPCLVYFYHTLHDIASNMRTKSAI